MPRFDPKYQCHNKRRYSTKKAAKKMVKKAKKINGVKYGVYHCPWCKFWHLGKRRYHERLKRRAKEKRKMDEPITSLTVIDKMDGTKSILENKNVELVGPWMKIRETNGEWFATTAAVVKSVMHITNREEIGDYIRAKEKQQKQEAATNG